MSEKVTIEITLDGREYSITGTESREHMEKIADYISLKEQVLNGEEGFRTLPKRLREYMMNFDIANDYFKCVDEMNKLKEAIEKKDEEIYGLKHELAKTQTDLSQTRIKKYGNPSYKEPDSVNATSSSNNLENGNEQS